MAKSKKTSKTTTDRCIKATEEILELISEMQIQSSVRLDVEEDLEVRINMMEDDTSNICRLRYVIAILTGQHD